MYNWDKKQTTNFSIDSILSKPEVVKDQKNSNEKSLPRLNKVFDNACPWTSKSPILYSPKSSHLPPYQQINYFNFYPPQNHYQNYYENLLQINQNFFSYSSPHPSEMSTPKSPTTPPISTPQKPTTPNFNVYDYNFLKITSDNKKICETKISNQILEINQESASDAIASSQIGTKFECKICLKVFENDLALSIHEKCHLKQKFVCNLCDKKFSQLRNFKYHLSIHRGTKEFSCTCPVCLKEFNDRGYLSSHLKIHNNKKEYLCPHCPKAFNQRVAYNMHLKIHTGIKPHFCTECGKSFSRKMLLKQHYRVHSGEKPYACNSCGKLFADRSNMILHQRLHSGVKPFPCTLCPKKFTKKHHLKTHLNYHTGNKPYVCVYSECNLRFTQSSNMRTHAKKCQYKPKDPEPNCGSAQK